MKRFLSIFLATILIFGSLSVVSAETNGAITLTTDNIKSATSASGSELSYTSKVVALECGSSAVYDMSGVEKGIYDITFNYSTQDSDTGLYLAVYLGDRLATKINIKNTESTANYADISAGTFAISPDSDLKVLCTSYVNKSIYLGTITLTPSSETSANYNFRQYADNATYTVAEDGSVSIANNIDYSDSNAFPDGNGVTLNDGNMYRERTQHANDWTRYDIKGMKSGTYNVTFYARLRTNTYLYFYIDEEWTSSTAQVEFNSANGNNGGSSYTLCANTISLTIPSGAEYLYVKSVSRASYVNYYDFEFLTDAVAISAVSAQIAKDASNADLDLTGDNLILNPGSYAEYDLSGLEPGIYDLSLNYSTKDTATGFYYDIYMGNSLVNKLKLTNTGGHTAFSDISAGSVEVKSGENLKITSTSYNGERTTLASITLTPNSEGTISYDFVQYADNVTLTVADGVASPALDIDYEDAGDKTFSSATSGYDSDENGTDDGRRRVQSTVGDWTRYNIEGIKSGIYNVTITATVRKASQLLFFISGDSVKKDEADVTFAWSSLWGDNTDAWTNLTGTTQITIPENAKYLWVQSGGSRGSYIQSYDFKYVEYEDDAPEGIIFTSDEAGENEIKKIGANATIYAHVSLGQNEEATVIIARYNGAEFVVDVLDEDIVSAKTYAITPNIGDTVKVFMWKDVDTTFSPLCGAGVID